MSTITQEQVLEMCEMQDDMNSKVYPDWRTKDFDWNLAGQMELMEGVDHYGWKWWKSQEPDLPQVQLEVVDAFHFFLSECMVVGVLFDVANLQMNTQLVEEVWSLDNKKSVYRSIARGYDSILLNQHRWQVLLKSVDMTPQDLYEMYIKKNVLNFFRQDNGYKEGTYTKIWNGEEDNVHLLRIADKLVEEGLFSQYTLREALEECYEGVLALGQS